MVVLFFDSELEGDKGNFLLLLICNDVNELTLFIIVININIIMSNYINDDIVHRITI